MKKGFLLFILLLSKVSLSQEVDDVIMSMKSFDIKATEKKLHLIDSNQVVYKNLRWQLDFLLDEENKSLDSIEKEVLNFKNKNARDSILSYITLGDLHRKKEIASDSLSLKFYLNSLKASKRIKDTIFISESYKRIFRLLYKNRISLDLYAEFLDDYENYIYDQNEKVSYTFYKYYFLSTTKGKEYIKELEEGFKSIPKDKNNYLRIKYLNIIGVSYSYFNKNYEKALEYYLKVEDIINKNSYSFIEEELFVIYGNIGIAYQNSKNDIGALVMFKKANSISVANNRLIEKVKINELIAELYKKQQKYDSAYYYLQQKLEYSNKLKEYENSTALNEINTKYKTAEKDKEIAEEKAKNASTNTKLTIALALLLLVIISAFLIQKNTRKKQLLAEQAKDLEAQKVSTLLKEQELSSIDAMIEGQEKERKRIAEDLHDDLGALMATINLHLENVGSENSPNALHKTKTLLSEAYTKIRNMSHVKNAGVIANQGLLVAVNNMTSKISSANKLDIEVIAHGLENQLENSLELSLFRMIQELIANIIKHAEATKATIQLTQFEKNLNIIVEDNGKGFDSKTIKETGIGLESIKKRIEHLEGKLTIDSTLGKGTTILIDIPLTI